MYACLCTKQTLHAVRRHKKNMQINMQAATAPYAAMLAGQTIILPMLAL
jgi:hypothetical protein